MRKLYENIENIHIKGSPMQLTEAITAMDFSLQSISDDTEQLYECLARYSTTNSGAQFQKVISTLVALRDELYFASVDLNEMQNQIVLYLNKILRYEDMAEYVTAPNPHLVQRRNFSLDTTTLQFNLAEMMDVGKNLRDYRESVDRHGCILFDRTEEMNSFWCDTQYFLFRQFIEELCFTLADALKEFDDYLIVLDQKIKELSQ